uniref:Peptidase S49 domain-containing protein n=1 Tax=Opuntia streptacantha TaxID=393608 RepID=A0A7C9ACE5_OPUST
MLITLLHNIYGNWLDKISAAKGKKREDVEKFINEGVYQIERLKDEGWITNISYEDEVISRLKQRLGLPEQKKLPMVDYRLYSRVRNWTLRLSGGKEHIAVIRASGSVRRFRGPLSAPTAGIVAEQLIQRIRSVRESKRYKAVVIRIDSPGGDALASDLLWREIRLLAAEKPVIASLADVAASGGYYIAMAAGTIVAENLTLTGSIGVVKGKFSLGKLYEKIGFNKAIISKGKYAELTAAEQRSFRPEEAELFAKSAQYAYTQFRDKAAYSRSMPIDKMEENAQGRVWTGSEAVSRGLVDAIGGMSRAIAIAKQKANIPLENKVTVVELSRPSPTLPEILTGIGSTLLGVETTVKTLLQDLASSEEIQARMDGIILEKLEDSSYSDPFFTILKDYLGSL